MLREKVSVVGDGNSEWKENKMEEGNQREEINKYGWGKREWNGETQENDIKRGKRKTSEREW